jgi:hypothetical protein
MADSERPTSQVPARRSFRSFGSCSCFHMAKRTPRAERTTAVIPRETGTTMGWLASSVVKLQNATPAYTASATAAPSAMCKASL